MKKKLIESHFMKNGLTLIMRKMKLTAFFSFLLFLSSWGTSLSQTTKLSLNLKNVPVQELIHQIEDQTEFYFLYQDDVFRNEQKVTIQTESESVESILQQMAEKTSVQYRIFERQIVLMPLGLTELPAGLKNQLEIQQQKKDVSGSVKDSEGNSLPGVSVVVKGTTTGVITDMNGQFRLSVPVDAQTLTFSFVGMKTHEILLGGKTNVNVTLEEEAVGIEEVVAVGYGMQKKVNLTGSVQNVTSEDLVKRSASNASNALQGLIPGVSVIQTSGRPGADGATIRIRGVGSLNSSSNPLVLIDGVEGDMNYIDLNSIESISVLKDAASASIYGSRASNGVILITTKRSKGKEMKVSYNGYAGFNIPTEMPDPVNAVEYMEAVNIANANSNQNPQYTESLINEYKTLGADNNTRYDTDWRDKIIKNQALTHNNSLSVSGGSKDIRFFGNAGYYYQDGQIANNDYDRMTLRLNTDMQMTDWVKIGIDVNIRQSKTIRPSLDAPEGIINKATTFVPVFSGINADGTWGYGQNGDNPIASAEASGLNTAISPELGVKGFIVLNPFKGFDFTASYSSRRLETKADYFLKPYDTYEGGVYKTTYPATGTEKYEDWSQEITNQFNLQATYEKQIVKHNIRVLGGIQTDEKTGRNFAASRKGYEFDGFEDIDHGNVATVANSGNHWEWAMMSYYGRVNYNFSDRYLIELNGRWDASSRFMNDSRWGFFPSASIGWRVSEESFFGPLKNAVNNLKIRGSYGTLGNQEIGSLFPYAATISTGYGYWFDKVLGTGATQAQVANEKISWEKSTQMNLGIDADFLKSRLNLTADYYIRNINDMLQQFPIPMYVGFSSPWENAGSMRNTGWDVALTWRDQIGDIKYHIRANLSDVKNEVTNLYGKEYVGTQITREGDPLGSWYGYVNEGYFQSMEEIDNSAVYGTRNNVKPGYIKYKDITGPDGTPDGVINELDRTIIGNPSPRYEYSLNLGAEWKGLDFSLFLQGVGKKEIYYSAHGARPFYVGRSIFKHHLDYWTEDNRDAEFPLLLIDGSGNNPNNIISDFWVKSGAYMRVKNVVIGYTLPKATLQRLNIEKIRIYASGQNLFTISNAYKGYDPESSVSGGNFYPLMKTFTLGMDINF